MFPFGMARKSSPLPRPIKGLGSAPTRSEKSSRPLLTMDSPMFNRKCEALLSRSPGESGLDLPPPDGPDPYTHRKEGGPHVATIRLPLLSDSPRSTTTPHSFNPSPEWFVPGLKPSLREDDEQDDDDGLGFRSLIEQPAALSKAWRTTGEERSGSGVRGARRHHTGRLPRSSAAA